MKVDNYFTMKEKTNQEFLDIHSECFKRSFEESSHRELVSFEKVSQNNQSFRDYKYSYIIIKPNINVSGFLECKQDSWPSEYMVSELFGSVSMKHVDESFLKKSFCKRIYPGKNKEAYDYLWEWVKKTISERLSGVGRKRGYGLAVKSALGDNPLFAYYNRAIDKKDKKILYRRWYLWEGDKLRDYTVDSFKNKRHPLQVIPNHDKRTGSKWVSINQLIPYTELDFCKKKYFELDKTIEKG
jgi:hypothetical protein